MAKVTAGMRLLQEVEGSRSAPINPNTCREVIAENIQLRECLELIQGQDWQLQDDETGVEITRRCLRVLGE